MRREAKGNRNPWRAVSMDEVEAPMYTDSQPRQTRILLCDDSPVERLARYFD